jgi:PhzF family phenazine biosynthesis protein
VKQRAFKQVDVFSTVPYLGNPLAVVLDGRGLNDQQMQGFARWTNLSETTFVLPPSNPDADYRVRIFTTRSELPFAGHPTLGSCHAWLEAGGHAKSEAQIVQECQAGLIRIQRDGSRLAFGAPPLLKTGPLDAATLTELARCLHIDASDILHHQWVDNGPGWMAVMLRSVEQVLALTPDFTGMGVVKLGVVAPYPPGAEHQFELRAFFTTTGVVEDPVTGSLNAGVAQWLIGAGLAPERYRASQGLAMARAGNIFVNRDAQGQIWVGGDSVTCINGSVLL